VREEPSWSGDIVRVPPGHYWPLFTSDALAPAGALEAAAGRTVEVELLVSIGPLDQVRQEVHRVVVTLPSDPREVWRAVWRAARPILEDAIRESIEEWGESLVGIELTGIRGL
jgi:hypothetical protein